MLIAALAAAFALGACAGSFLGVVVHRMPRALSIVRPRSRCGACGTALAGHDNLPILGWLLLRGRCRHCGTPIPASCLWMELAVAAISTAVVWAALTQPLLHPHWLYAALAQEGLAPVAYWLPRLLAGGVLLMLTWLLIAAVLIDWDHLMIPDELTKGLQAVAIPLAVLTYANCVWSEQPNGAMALPVDPLHWLRHQDVMQGWQATPQRAAAITGAAAAVGLGLIAATLLLARRIYGGLARDAWEERDHQAMARGAWWYIGCTVLWTGLGLAVLLALPTDAYLNDWGVGLLLGKALIQAVLGSLVGWWLPWAVGLVGSVAFKRNAMGYGDVKLFCGLGAFLGPLGTLAAFMFATVVGALIGIPARLLGGGREMPFGPSLAIGAVLAIVLGPWLAPLAIGSLLG